MKLGKIALSLILLATLIAALAMPALAAPVIKELPAPNISFGDQWDVPGQQGWLTDGWSDYLKLWDNPPEEWGIISWMPDAIQKGFEAAGSKKAGLSVDDFLKAKYLVLELNSPYLNGPDAKSGQGFPMVDFVTDIPLFEMVEIEGLDPLSYRHNAGITDFAINLNKCNVSTDDLVIRIDLAKLDGGDYDFSWALFLEKALIQKPKFIAFIPWTSDLLDTWFDVKAAYLEYDEAAAPGGGGGGGGGSAKTGDSGFLFLAIAGLAVSAFTLTRARKLKVK